MRSTGSGSCHCDTNNVIDGAQRHLICTSACKCLISRQKLGKLDVHGARVIVLAIHLPSALHPTRRDFAQPVSLSTPALRANIRLQHLYRRPAMLPTAAQMRPSGDTTHSFYRLPQAAGLPAPAPEVEPVDARL